MISNYKIKCKFLLRILPTCVSLSFHTSVSGHQSVEDVEDVPQAQVTALPHKQVFLPFPDASMHPLQPDFMICVGIILKNKLSQGETHAMNFMGNQLEGSLATIFTYSSAIASNRSI